MLVKTEVFIKKFLKDLSQIIFFQQIYKDHL